MYFQNLFISFEQVSKQTQTVYVHMSDFVLLRLVSTSVVYRSCINWNWTPYSEGGKVPGQRWRSNYDPRLW